jgi:hypothetical protein
MCLHAAELVQGITGVERPLITRHYRNDGIQLQITSGEIKIAAALDTFCC